MAKVEMHHLEQIHNLVTNEKDVKSQKYEVDEVVLIGRIIEELNKRITIQGYGFAQKYISAQQYMVHKGLNVFGEKCKKVVYVYMDQLHKRNFLCLYQLSL